MIKNNNQSFNEYAVVDLGSNSFHMIIARKVDNTLQTIYKNKQTIHLAAGLNAQNYLSKNSIQRGIDCLTLFAERLQEIPTKNIKVIATHTIRVAKNKHQFITEAAKVFPYPIEIISGQEEARLIYLGAIANESTTLQTDVKLIIDIGGGSTEVAIGTTNSPQMTDSRPIGCISYSKRYFPKQKIDKAAFNKAVESAEQHFEKLANYVRNKEIFIAFGSSGTIKNIHQILLDLGVTDGIITRKRLDDLISYVFEFKHFKDINYPSLSAERKTVFLGGLAIFSGVFNVLGLKELHYCQSALREGVLYEMTNSDENYQDTRQNTAIALSKMYDIDERHASQVVMTTKVLLNQWKSQASYTIDQNIEAIVYWAALLHEVGLSINFSSIHKHSAYILQNSNMPGFNEEQQLLLATLVRLHRKSIKLNVIPYFTLFEPKHIYPLLQILRLAVLINNSRPNSIDFSAFKLQLIDNELTKFKLIIDKRFADNNKLLLLDLEQEQQYWRTHKDWQLMIIIQ